MKFSNILYSILGNAVNRLLIGKSFWKGIILPNILYGDDIIPFNVSELDKIQSIENKAYRTILQLPKSTAIEFLRGEVGTSIIKSRDMKNKLSFLQHALKPESNNLLREIVLIDLRNSYTAWIKQTIKYLNDIRIDINLLDSISNEQLATKINEYDESIWRSNMENKSTLRLYKYKKKLGNINWFRNGAKYDTMMHACSNTLDLSWRNWTSDDKTCQLCKSEIETLKHFLLDCNKLQKFRNNFLFLQLPRQYNKDQTLMKEILLLNSTSIAEEYYINIVHT